MLDDLRRLNPALESRTVSPLRQLRRALAEHAASSKRVSTLVCALRQAWSTRVGRIGGALLLGAQLSCGHTPTTHQPEPIDIPKIEGNVIRFSDSYAKRIDLKTVEVRSAGVVPSLAVVGTVAFDPQQVAQVGTRLRGLVRDVRRYEGDVVKRGEVLASVDSPELGEAQAAVISIQAELDAAKRNAAREKKLAEEKLTTLKESEEANALAERFQALFAAANQKVTALAGTAAFTNAGTIGVHNVTSPLEGTIVERHIAKGQLVEGDHTAFLVANLNTLWVELAVFERSLPLIRVGDEVVLTPLGSRTAALLGKVANVGQILNSSTRSAPVRVEVDNRGRLLRPGQAVDAVIRASGAALAPRPIVPSIAVTFVDGKPTVFVVESDTAVRVAAVELGASDGREFHIERGLSAGERVVTNGTFELKSELFR